MINQHRSSDVRIARIAIGIIIVFLAAGAILVYAFSSLFKSAGNMLMNDHVLNVGQTGVFDYPAAECFDSLADLEALEHPGLTHDVKTEQRVVSRGVFFQSG